MFMRRLPSGTALVATKLVLAGSALLVHRAMGEPLPVLAKASKAPTKPVARFAQAQDGRRGDRFQAG
jgi:hypothetical protein